MKRIIVTNNKKVEFHYAGKNEVIMLNNASALNVLREGEKLALKGGRLMMDPSRRKGYFKSLIFLMEAESCSPDEKSLALIKGCIEEVGKQANSNDNKEPILAGILQNRDLNLVKSILN